MAETTPTVTVLSKASGSPIAMTHSPTRAFSESPERKGRQALLHVDLEQGEVGGRIPADELGRVLFLVVDPDLDLVGAVDDVVVRDDVAVFRDDESGAALDLLVLLVVLLPAALVARGAEEELERIALAAVRG